MGQKVNPVGMRVGLNKNWNSRWYASDKDYSRFLAEDIKIREFLEKKIGRDSQLSHIEIERKKNDKGYFVRVIVFVAKPGTVIGQKGENIRKAGAKGCKTAVSGRLAGADIARTEGYKEGTMAINTLTSDIDYSQREAMTTYGKLGVKVWICRGEIEINPRNVEADSQTKGE